MTRGVKVRLLAFVVLAAVGIVYIAGSYLGLVDRVLGRGLTIHATLPGSGGLFEGSSVTYRGVKVGKVSGMHVTRDGLRLDLALEEGTEVPLDSRLEVHNLSAVGEQYLDIIPPDSSGPYAEDGARLKGDADSLPVGEDDLLVDLDELVGSVDSKNLNTVIAELGATFQDTADPLEQMVESGSDFLEAALANEEATFELLDNGGTVLETQQRHRADIRLFASSLADLTGELRGRDPELRTVLEGGGAAVREVERLVAGLEPTMPVFIGNLVTLNQILTTRLPALEQLLVTFPKIVANGFTGTPGDGYGHINLQLAQEPGPCRDGFMPDDDWRESSDLTDTDVYPAECRQGPPFNLRGSKYAPRFGGSTNRAPVSGAVTDDPPVTIGRSGGQRDLFGDDSWRWMLLGPLEGS